MNQLPDGGAANDAQRMATFRACGEFLFREVVRPYRGKIPPRGPLPSG